MKQARLKRNLKVKKTRKQVFLNCLAATDDGSKRYGMVDFTIMRRRLNLPATTAPPSPSSTASTDGSPAQYPCRLLRVGHRQLH